MTSAAAESILPARESQWEWMCGLSPDAPGASPYVVVDNRFVDATLDERALRAAFADVTARHEGLRLLFDTLGSKPRVHVEPTVEPPVEHLDLSPLAQAERDDRVTELVRAEYNRAFDLLRGPAWHAWHVRLGPARHFLNVTFSEIVADGWSTKVFMEDLLTAYASRTGAPAPAAAPLSFAEMHALQSRRLAPRRERLAHWREQLLPLGRDVPMRHVDEHASVRARSRIDAAFAPGVLTALRRLAWRSRTSVYVALMAAYHALLSIATGRDRTVLSTAVLGRRTTPERRSLLPCTVDTYVATTLPPDTSLADAVRRTHDSIDRALANLVSFTSVARAVNPAFESHRPWPDMHLCDGNFYAAAYEDLHLSVAGMPVTTPHVSTWAGAGPPTSPRADALPPAQRAVWLAYCGPSVEISHARDACAVMFNDEIYADDEIRAHLDAYLWIVGLMASSPDLSVGALADRYARRASVAGRL